MTSSFKNSSEHLSVIDLAKQNTTEQSSLEDDIPWYAIRLFTIKLQIVIDYFDGHGVKYFVPMECVEVEDREHKPIMRMQPVVKNLIFVKIADAELKLRNLLTDAPFKSSVIRRSRDDDRYYEIPARQMFEFMAMCNPNIAMRKYLTEQEAKYKVGAPVYVKYGPLKGLSGRLVRSNKKYFLLKEVPGFAVMLKVSRWCCRAVVKK